MFILHGICFFLVLVTIITKLNKNCINGSYKQNPRRDKRKEYSAMITNFFLASLYDIIKLLNSYFWMSWIP